MASIKKTSRFAAWSAPGTADAAPAPARAAPAPATTTTASKGCTVVDESDNAAVQKLKSLGLQQTTYAHEAAFTVAEQAAHLEGVIEGNLTKNLFLRDKKHGLYLVTTLSTREVNFKTIGSLLKLSGSNFRLGDEDLLKEKLGVIRGSVSPLALINDTNCEVTFCIDSELFGDAMINVHPLRNDRTTSMPASTMKAFLTDVKHEPVVLDFSTVAAPAPAANGGAKPAKKPAEPKAAKQKPSQAPKPKKENDGDGKNVKKETMLAITATKEDDFANWYTQTITLSEMIDYSDISGCYILRPWSFFIWEQITQWFDNEIKKFGVRNTYFPLFVSEKALNTEKDHVEGFAPEVAWVTKSGTSDLAEPIAVRPTSETIMYPFFAKWIRSHRDLPLEINQWCNVVRWEFKDATPFLRSREFLWQEGHTAHSSYENAQERVLSILELYKQVYEYLLAVPVIKGMKTEVEKFAGGFHTTTCEAYINGSGRAIQGATSHNLGQNFGKMFDIVYEDDKGEKAIPWQTSWGLTTRTIGVCVMVHGDNKGLVLPPRVAPLQVIILPIAMKNTDYKDLLDYAEEIEAVLKPLGVRVQVDSRQNYTPGWKFNHWEQKGVPIRMEVGPRDLSSRQARLVRRDEGDKCDIAFADLAVKVPELLDTIQNHLFEKAKAGRDEKLVTVMEWKDFVPALEKSCLVLTPFCDESDWEEKVKDMSKEEALKGGEEEATTATSVAAKTLCKPFDQPPLPEGTPCFVSGKPATTWVLWGRSY
jgi:prolyl-tRNA synthetase